MADNFTVLDGNGNPRTLKSTDASGVHTPHQHVASLPGTVAADVTAGKTAAEALAALIAGGRFPVDLSSAVITLLGNLSTLATVAARQLPPTALYGGSVNVSTPGTRVQLSVSSVPLTEGVWVRAKDANSGLIYPGNASVSSSAAGTRLAFKEALFIRIDDLNKVYIDAAVGGEGVTYLGW